MYRKYTPAAFSNLANSVQGVVVYLWRELQKISDAIIIDDVWDDYTSPMASGKSPAAAPTPTAFGPNGITEQLKFAVNDIVYLNFHILHDISRNTKVYPHIHWSHDVTASGSATWQLTYSVAKGHDQESFPADTTANFAIKLNDSMPWRHIISEVSDNAAFAAPEPDSVVLTRVKLTANNSNANVFGLYVDLHYQKDRAGTRYKAPDFYGELE